MSDSTDTKSLEDREIEIRRIRAWLRSDAYNYSDAELNSLYDISQSIWFLTTTVWNETEFMTVFTEAFPEADANDVHKEAIYITCFAIAGWLSKKYGDKATNFL